MLTAREWILLPREEQLKRGKELSPEECRKLRMELSEIYISEEEKRKMTEEEKEGFIHPPKKNKKELEKDARDSFEVLKEFEILPKEVDFDEWIKRGKPLNWYEGGINK